MMRSWIKTGIATGLLTVGGLPAETLYEKDGITIEGSVRMAGRNAAICQVLAESESPAYVSPSPPARGTGGDEGGPPR